MASLAYTTCPACGDKCDVENITCTCRGVGFMQHIVGCPGGQPGAVYKCTHCGAEMHASDFLMGM